MSKRIVEVFSAGCSACQATIDLVNDIACGACEVMSPIVRSVADRWHITVRAISTDGGPSRHFPDYKVESGHKGPMTSYHPSRGLPSEEGLCGRRCFYLQGCAPCAPPFRLGRMKLNAAHCTQLSPHRALHLAKSLPISGADTTAPDPGRRWTECI